MARVSIGQKRRGQDEVTLAPVEIRGFRGVNNRLPEHRLEINDLLQGVNVDLDDSGMAERRGGITRKIAGRFHSLWNDGLPFALGAVSGLSGVPLTLTRTTSKWYFDADGVLQEATSGNPGFGPNGLTIDPARTNLLTNNKYTGGDPPTDWAAPVDTGSRTISDSEISGQKKIQYTGTSQGPWIWNTGVGFSASTTYVFYVRKLAGSVIAGNVTVLSVSGLTGVSGDISVGDGEEDANGLLKSTLTTDTDTSGAFRTGLGCVTDASGDITLDIPQIEEGSFITRPILTDSGSTTTRNADVVSGPSPDILNASGTNIIIGKETPFAEAMGEYYLYWCGVDADNHIAVLKNDTQLIARRRHLGVNHDAVIAMTYTAGQEVFWRALFSEDRCAIWNNQTKGTDNTDSVPVHLGATMSLGGDGQGGGVASTEIYDYAMGAGVIADADVVLLPNDNILPMVRYSLKENLDADPAGLQKITRNGDGSLATTTLIDDIGSDPISYVQVAGDVYYANGRITGMVRNGQNRSWGVPVPPRQPSVSATTGALYAGSYQVAITFVDTDGRESGATVANRATLATVGGLSVTGIPTGGSDIDKVRVYVTPPNGERLYLARTVSNGTGSVSITSGLHHTIPLVTQFLNEPPVGSLVAHDNGRIFVADGPFVFASLPHTYHLFDYEHYFHFPEDVTFMMAVPNSGIVTSSDRLRFFPSNFTDAHQVPVTVLGDYKALPGVGTKMDGRHFGAAGEWAAFTTEQGVCVMAGQEFRNLTHERYAFGGQRAAMIAREMGGFSQLLSMVRDSDSTGNVHVSDQASATVIRNGVIL